MWEQVQQLFKLYYMFHFLCPGILNTTLEPLLKTSNFFLCISCQSPCFFCVCVCMCEQKRMLILHMCWALPLLCGGEFLVESHFLRNRAFSGHTLNNCPQDAEKPNEKICVLGVIIQAQRKRSNLFGPMQVQTAASLCRLICREG